MGFISKNIFFRKIGISFKSFKIPSSKFPAPAMVQWLKFLTQKILYGYKLKSFFKIRQVVVFLSLNSWARREIGTFGSFATLALTAALFSTVLTFLCLTGVLTSWRIQFLQISQRYNEWQAQKDDYLGQSYGEVRQKCSQKNDQFS